MLKQASGIIFLCFIFSGCAQKEIYRSDISECLVTPYNQCGASSFQVYNDAGFKYSLATVEIDDQGQLQKRDQLDLMLNKLKSVESALIIVFVHGWHHNSQGATPEEHEDLNIQNFRSQLAAISTEEKNNTNPRRVFGVYVGWRGDSIEVDGLNVATFWDRKNTAEEVGHLGLTETLLRLEEIRDKKNTAESKPKSRLVVVGHSFGGAAVFSATAQIFADRYIKKHDSEGHHKNLDNSHEGFGDLVVLINPAFEALRYAPLYDMAQSDCTDNPEQKPKLTILTSEGDEATGKLFPLGRSLYTLPETHNNHVEREFCASKWKYTLAEGEADRTTVGHFEPFFTHTLEPLGNKTPHPKELSVETTSKRWRNNTGEINFGNIALKHLGKTNLHNPYLNIRVSNEIIEGHNDIFKPEIVNFIKGLISYSISDKD